ncbi:MAG: hypothetical protein IJP02_06615 [Oscillospiraceae bacterium]|nr:hypothetical protein [Oscillospiraceae bacterium]
MLMYIYLGILAVLSVLIIRNMFRSHNVFHYFEAVLVLIPFLLRLLRIK